MWGGEVHTGFWWGNMMEGGHLEDLEGEGKIKFNVSSRNVIWA
jgi:hypothetical protein